MSTLRLAGLVAPMFAALAHTAAAAEVWSPYKPSGMEYRLMSGVQKYSTAKAICASEGTDASLASPATADAADFVYGMSSSETWLGLSNDMVGRPKPCRDHSVFNWDSGMVCQMEYTKNKYFIPISQIFFHNVFSVHGDFCLVQRLLPTANRSSPPTPAPACTKPHRKKKKISTCIKS